MNFKAVVRCGRIHVVKNGVESECFAVLGHSGHWLIFHPVLCDQVSSLEKMLRFLTASMDTWYTVTEAAARLVELGKTGKRPSAVQTMYRWLRQGRFPGAIKIQAAGRGGPWRIPEAALRKFTKRGGEKK